MNISIEKLFSNNKKPFILNNCKYDNKEESIAIAPVSNKELHTILPKNYKDHLSGIKVTSIFELFKMIDKVFWENKDSKLIYLYFCIDSAGIRWYKITLRFINRDANESLKFCKDSLLQYFRVNTNEV